LVTRHFSRRQLVGSSVGASLAVSAAAVGGAHSVSAQDMMNWDVSQSVRPTLTPVAQMAAASDDEVHLAIAPSVPPQIARADQRTWSVHLEAIEGISPLDPENTINTLMWGFREAGREEILSGSPGPVLRGRVGDFATITLSNLKSSMHPHNIDFHAVTGQGGGATALTVNPGDTKSVMVRLMYPGVYMYHCAAEDVPVHIAHGMYGMFIVDPETPLPAVDHEWSISQSEWYLSAVGPADEGVARFNRDLLLAETPSHFTFNGRTDAIKGDNALKMNVGERARIYFVNQGLNHLSSFHPIGSHWDLVYPEGALHPANRVIRGSQSTLVVAGGGTVTEVDALVPSTVVLVDHALSRVFYKGLIGHIKIEGDANPEIFAVPEGQGELPDSMHGGAAATPVAVDVEVAITPNAYLPENKDHAFDPPLVQLTVGQTIRWTNHDAIAHTVTSGVSDGLAGVPDGKFDSGYIDAGGTFEMTFTEAGGYPYFCMPHPWMRGSILVK
jgi:nitrite reductase (NO-forming)